MLSLVEMYAEGQHLCCAVVHWCTPEGNQMVSTLGFQKEDVIVWANAGGSAAIEFQRLGTPVLLLFELIEVSAFISEVRFPLIFFGFPLFCSLSSVSI